MNFHRTKNLLQMDSYDLWACSQKIIIYGNLNPRGCDQLHTHTGIGKGCTCTRAIMEQRRKCPV